MTRTVADVVIIGGGVIGCSVAFHLARQRNLRVIIVEKGSLASGMTKRSGGLIHPRHAHATEARLAQASLKDWRNWKEIVGGNCGFTPTGIVVTAGTLDDARLRDEVTQLERIGVHSKTISPGELKELEPHARVDDVTIAAYSPDAGYADPGLATQSLAARAKELGAIFKTGTLVKNIRVELGRVVGVATTTGDIDALTVVVAAGARTDRLLKPHDVQLGIRNTRAHVAFFDRPAELKAGHAAFIDYTTGAHCRPHTFGLTMAGLNESHIEESNPDSLDETVPQDFIDDVRQRIAARLPAMTNARYVRGHAGTYDITPRARPTISRVPGLAGLIVAAGFGGIGLMLAPAVGACVAEMVTDGEARSVNVEELRIG